VVTDTRQTGAGGAGLVNPLVHLTPLLPVDQASAGSAKRRRTFFSSMSKAAASARAWSLRATSCSNALMRL